MVPYETVCNLMESLGIPEETPRVWNILCAVKFATQSESRITQYLESQGYTVTDVSACMTAIRRIHTRNSCFGNRKMDTAYRVIATAIHALSDTNAHVDPWVLQEFKSIMWGVAHEHALLYVQAGYDMSPAGVVVILLCACHDYLFSRNSHTHCIMDLFLFEAFVAVSL